MRLRRSWNVAIVVAAVSLTVTLQLAGATEASAAIGGVASGAVGNTAALDPEGGAGSWSVLVALVFLLVANLMAFGRRRPVGLA